MIRLCPLLFLVACTEPTDIGERCSQDEKVVSDVLAPRPGENRIALDVMFERCFQFLCVSINGHDPYCTHPCGRAEDCPTGFVCQNPIEFGPLSRICENDASTDCSPAAYCVRADEWAGVGQQPAGDAGP